MRNSAWCAAAVAATAGAAAADSVQVVAQRDNTLYENTLGSLSNGLGENFFVGMTAQGQIRRGLIRFDVAGAVPAGSTITRVTLTVTLTLTISFDQDISLFRSLKDWGEGTSVAGLPGGIGGGSGAPATPGDATWVHTFHNTSFWGTPGGSPTGANPDYVEAPSATTIIGSEIQPYSWQSTPELIADVQGWLDAPASNFGWFVIGGEGTFATAKRIAAKDHPTPADRPTLTITFDPPVSSCYADCNYDHALNVNDFICFQSAFAAALPAADCNHDTTLNVNDFICFQSAFAAGCSAP